MKDAVMGFSVTLILFLMLMPLILKACDREYDYQQATVQQWIKESKAP